MWLRTQTRSVKVGKVALGGGAPVSVQTMANVEAHDAAGLIAQAKACEAVGCDIFRLTVPDVEAAAVLGEVKKQVAMPLVADIHFDYRCALAALEAGADALRLNPGNIGGQANVRTVARAAAGKGVPIRIGVNRGSLEKDLDERVRGGKLGVAEALCESAMRHVKMLEDEKFYDIVISVKASNVRETLAAYRRLAEETDCPLHLGVTEAGTFMPGTVRSSVALGILLEEGIGDTIRVSLTDKPEKEVRVGMEILRALGMREAGPAITSCPTCGRTKADVFGVAAEVEEELEKLYQARRAAGDKRAFARVAVMGCVVNGPGEARGADVALCGGVGEFLIYEKGQLVGKVAERDAAKEVLKHVIRL